MMNNDYEEYDEMEYDFGTYTGQEIIDAMVEEDGEKLMILDLDRLHCNLPSEYFSACQMTMGDYRNMRPDRKYDLWYDYRNHWIVATRV